VIDFNVVLAALLNAFYGALCGAAVALLGYAKSSSVESFEPKKAIQTVIVGAVVGVASTQLGFTYQQAYEWCANMGVLTLVEYIKKAIIRRL
jgi:hypothetical protein